MARCNEKTFEEITTEHQVAPVSEEQAPTEATPTSTEIAPTPLGISTEELLPIEMMSCLTLSSSESKQPL